MSDVQDLPEDQDLDAAEAPSELDSLKARATLLGIQFHPSIGLEKLREKVNAKLNDEPEPEEEEAPAAPVQAKQAETGVADETPGQKRVRLRREALKLIRVRITCMNPFKKEWEGEILTAGNNGVGTVKRYVPFNNEEGWHVENIILEQLRERKCQIFVTEKDSRGNKIRKGKLIREFAIEILDPLTPAELKELAQRQAMAAGQ